MTPALSDEQREFVLACPAAHQSLQSWAGTGKTHTLTERVVRLVEVHGVDPATIIITTFTVEGARECAERLCARLGGQRGVLVGTMDSLANRWMRQYFAPADYYTGVQEYGPLLLEFLRTPEGHAVKGRVRYLVVDEFQDLSQTQLDTVLEFYSSGARIIAIGDVAQNIYEWRGCHGHFLTSLPHRITGMREFRLTANRRCTPEIIDAGNACLEVLRQPSTRLMRPVRPSNGHRPALETLPPRISLGAHVVRLVRYYSRCCGVAFGDITVLSRYKQGLFAVEEALIRLTHDKIPFVTSASVGDADQSPRRKPDHMTLMTLHQSKGLEWPCVILLLWDPRDSDEEWRLMYVAITRARDRLHVLSPTTACTRAFFKRVHPRLFVDPDGAPCDPEAGAADPARAGPCLAPDVRSGVVDVIRSLTSSHIHEMRRLGLIPMTRGVLHAAPGCRIRVFRFVRESQRFAEVHNHQGSEVPGPPEDAVDANGLQIEFGNFVDRYISRKLLVAQKKTIEDRDARRLLGTLFVPRDMYYAVLRHTEAVSEFCRSPDQRIDILSNLSSTGADKGRLEVLNRVFDRLTLHARATRVPLTEVCIDQGRQAMTFKELVQLRVAYERYSDSSTPTPDGTATPESVEAAQRKAHFATHRVALAAVVLKGRKSMWYHREAYAWFRRKLATLLPCIERYIEVLAQASDLRVKPLLHSACMTGEADVLTERTVVDFKCSTRTQDFAWFGQGLAYMAMAPPDSRPNTLQVFNPVMRTVWEFDCTDWTHDARAAFLAYLDAVAVQQQQQQQQRT
jgi:hypothetical protein